MLHCAILVLAASLLTLQIEGQTPPKRPSFDAFEVAVIKPVNPELRSGRFIRMQSGQTFQIKNYTVRELIAAAYDLTPRGISGGPGWTESDRYDITARTPGQTRPTYDEQMTMLKDLLRARFGLGFRREQKVFSIYEITVENNGPKLEASSLTPEDSSNVTSTVFPASSGGIDHIVMPGRNASMAQFASVLQRAVLDRPVVDKTGLTRRYNFDLEWTPDESQFGGELPAGAPDTPKPGLFEAVQKQLGLRLTATRGPVETIVINGIHRPSEN